VSCAHEVLRALAGGVCPLCPEAHEPRLHAREVDTDQVQEHRGTGGERALGETVLDDASLAGGREAARVPVQVTVLNLDASGSGRAAECLNAPDRVGAASARGVHGRRRVKSMASHALPLLGGAAGGGTEPQVTTVQTQAPDLQEVHDRGIGVGRAEREDAGDRVSPDRLTLAHELHDRVEGARGNAELAHLPLLGAEHGRVSTPRTREADASDPHALALDVIGGALASEIVDDVGKGDAPRGDLGIEDGARIGEESKSRRHDGNVPIPGALVNAASLPEVKAVLGVRKYVCSRCGADGHSARTCGRSPVRHDRARRMARNAQAAIAPTPTVVTPTLTAALAAKLYRKVRRRLGYLYLREFVRDAWPEIEAGVDADRDWNWHLDAICDHVQWMLEGWLIASGHAAARTIAPDSRALCTPFVQNLLINAAPATLKSKIVMVFAPAWMWLRAPTWSHAALSGNSDNVTRDSNACRDLVQSEWYRTTFQVTWTIRSDVAAVGKWKTTAGGERISRGLSAAATGIHVDALFCDDPETASEVWGEAARKATRTNWAAYQNRVNSEAYSIRIMVQQRLHPDDLSSTLLDMGNWAHWYAAVEFDARHVCTTPWGWTDPRAANDNVPRNMHPARFSDKVLADARVALSLQYQAQYNQRPDNVEGSMFKRANLRFWRREGARGERPMLARPDGCLDRETCPAIPLPKLDAVALTLDGSGGSMSGDRAGLLAVGLAGVERFVLADRTRRANGAGSMARMIMELIAWLLEEFPDQPGVKKIVVETKALGVSVIEKLEEYIRDGKLVGVNIVPVDPKGDSKEARAVAMEADINESHRLYVEDGASWLTSGHDRDDVGFIAELCSFPGGKHDDRVDALSQLWRYFAVNKTIAKMAAAVAAMRTARPHRPAM